MIKNYFLNLFQNIELVFEVRKEKYGLIRNRIIELRSFILFYFTKNLVRYFIFI